MGLQEISPMEARLVAELPYDCGWQFEPKWDGFRCIATKSGDDVELTAKSGKSLARYFPEVIENLRREFKHDVMLDGELAIPQGNNLSFDSLLARLHPAESRIRRLAEETPAILILFDCLADRQNHFLAEVPFVERRGALEAVFEGQNRRGPFRLTPYTREREEALVWLRATGGEMDGVVAKRLNEPYRAGERGMLKIKNLRTADCVVGGFRYESDGRGVGSLLLGLYNRDGLLDHVGFTSAISNADRSEITKLLQPLIEQPGFTGKAPGASSRWSNGRSTEWMPLRPQLVVEIRYDHVTGARFRHGTQLIRWRPDKAPNQCTFDQMEQPARPDMLIADIVGRAD